ncbi:endo alpha-1,4 polygalactosaminidase, partial [Acinetobacter baumannii]
DWPEGTLLERDGEPVIDPDWPDERLADTSTAEKRDRVVAHVAPWVRGCAASGFRAVEFDNLDTFTRTDGALTLQDNAAVATALVRVAHEMGLANRVARHGGALELAVELATQIAAFPQQCLRN